VKPRLLTLHFLQKSNNKDRLAQNLNHTEFDLTEAELKAVSALNKNLRWVSSLR
jgi:D-xylose reductase